MSKVAVALSGGEDSAFSSYLMLKKGYEVIGFYIDFGFGRKTERVEEITKFLGIPLHVINLRKIFFNEVVPYFINSYLSGKTPNPCIMCNKLVKFGKLLKEAKKLGAEKLVTGHYAIVEKKEEKWILKRGVDKNKDQSYFLFPLLDGTLKEVYFPLGKWMKEDVKKEIEKIGIPAEHRESQEVCFLNYEEIKHKVIEEMKKKAKPGKVFTKDGKEVGNHQGICFFTIGQRKGIGIPFGKPYYVISILPEGNAIIVGKEEDVYSRNLVAENLIWEKGYEVKKGKIIEAKIRYKSDLAKAKIEFWDGRNLNLSFQKKQWAITPGQAVVMYENDEVIGGGWIK